MPENSTQPPQPPNSPPGAARRSAKPGLVVIFGLKDSRLIRVPDRQEAMKQAERQRHGTEPVRIYDGADYGTKLREGASPLFSAERGQSFEDASKQARQA